LNHEPVQPAQQRGAAGAIGQRLHDVARRCEQRVVRVDLPVELDDGRAQHILVDRRTFDQPHIFQVSRVAVRRGARHTEDLYDVGGAQLFALFVEEA